MSTNVISLGTFKTGETPLDLSVRFDDNDGNQIDISGYDTATGYWKPRNAAKADATVLAVTIQTSPNPLGLAVVNMTADMVDTTGAYEMEVWVGTTSNVIALASKTYTYLVEESVGDTPTL